MERYNEAAPRKTSSVPPCAVDGAALCSTGVALLLVYGAAPGLLAPAAPLPGLAALVSLPLVGAPPVASERFDAWLSRHADRVGKIAGRYYDLAELRRAFAAFPYTKNVALGTAALTHGTRTTHVLLLDGDGWRVALAEISCPQPLTNAPEWDAEPAGKEAVAA
jgi:hypothetical protein